MKGSVWEANVLAQQVYHMQLKSSELFRMLLALKEAIRIRQSIGVSNISCVVFPWRKVSTNLSANWPKVGVIESVRSANVDTQFERGVVVVS